MDTLDKAQRSERMSRIRSRDTKPEIFVRQLIHGLGYRYRLHASDLPGSPDIVFRKQRKAIFVHGCFWHRHADLACKRARMPKTRLDFWGPKLQSNELRDRRILFELDAMGWQSLIVWECDLKHREQLENILVEFLEDRT